MTAERDLALQLIAFGMCLANRKILNATNPEDFADEEIRQAVSELKAPRVEGQPEPEMPNVVKLLERWGAEPKRFGTLSEAVQMGVREYAKYLDRKKRLRKVSCVSLGGAGTSPQQRREWGERVDRMIEELAKQVGR
jgi:hypothetical protein